MKKLFTVSAIALSALVFAQEAGRAGELLKNEAGRTEMQTQRKEVLGSRGNESVRNNGSSGTIDNSNYRTQNRSGQSVQKINKNYQWNQNYGYSEVFLRIPERGYFTVEVGNQMMSNSSGKFRFFDLGSGRVPVSIYENGYLLYRTKINVRNHSRMILDFFSDYGLYLLDTVPVQSYGFNQWDDVWNSPYGNGSNGYGNYVAGMDARSFSAFMNALQKISFDRDRSAFISSQARNAVFSAAQIKQILGVFSFDKDRLQAAKQLYRSCADKQNFFVVYDTFDFDRDRRELMQYVASV